MLPRIIALRFAAGIVAASAIFTGGGLAAQERLPWERSAPPAGMQRLGADEEPYRNEPPPPAPYRPNVYGQPPASGGYGGGGYSGGGYPGSNQGGGYAQQRPGDAYSPPAGGGYGNGSQYGSQPYPARTGTPTNDAYRPPASGGSGGYAASGTESYRPPAASGSGYGTGGGYGAPYTPPTAYEDPDPAEAGPRRYAGPAPEERGGPVRGYYTQNEITQAGHGFFGSVSRGLASAIEYAFQKAGRPNGYILGEDAGGAFVAGLRYGEGKLFTKDAGTHKVYWQGPSLGYDVGAEGSKTMVLVYNLRDPSDIYHRFGGVQGSAYLVGGVSVQFQKYGDVVLAPIRSGLGLRLGANVGYLKYTRNATWNPF